jgi:uncharacterized membrane protein
MKRNDYLVAAGIFLYTTIFSIFTISRYKALYVFAYDFGIFEQMLWSTINGNFMYQTINEISFNHFGIHFQPILLALLPIYFMFPQGETLLILQSLFIGLGALPIYLIAKRELKNPSIVFPVAYLLYSPMHNVNLFDFHPVAFAPFLLGFTWYYMEKNDSKKFLIFSLLSLTIKESIFTIIFIIGLYSAVFKKNLKIGTAVSAAALLWGIISIFYIIPSISGVPYIFASGNAVNDTLASFPFSNFVKLLYEFAKPVGFTSLFYPIPLIVTGALLIRHSMYNVNEIMYHQYPASIAVFIFISSIYFVSRTTPWIAKKLKYKREKLQSYAVALVLLSSLLTFANSSIFDLKEIHYKQTEHDRIGLEIIALIPENASVSSQVHLVPRLTHRKYSFMLGRTPEEWKYNVDYVMFDTRPETVRELWPFAQDINSYNLLIQSYIDNENYEVAANNDGYVLFRKEN